MATTTPSSAGTTSAPGLKGNALGTSNLVFIVVSAAAPLMVMVGVAPLVITIGGVGAPAAYVFAGIALAIFAVGFTTMSRHIDNAGAFYSYIAVGLGRTSGVVAALVALVSYNALQIGVYGLAGVAIQGTFAEVFGIDQPWWVYAFACILIVWYVGFSTVDFGAKFLAVLLTAETALLLILAVAIVVQGGTSEGLGLESFAPENMFVQPMTVILPPAFAAFMGFEATVIYRSETRNPRRTIPRATYIAVAVLAGTYAFIVWSIIQAFGASGAVDAATETGVGMFFVAGETYVGSWFTTAMQLLIATSVVASLVAFHNAVTRYALAIADEGLLPKVLARTHPRTRSPYVAGAAQTALAVAIVGGFAVAKADPYSQLLIWGEHPRHLRHPAASGRRRDLGGGLLPPPRDLREGVEHRGRSAGFGRAHDLRLRAGRQEHLVPHRHHRTGQPGRAADHPGHLRDRRCLGVLAAPQPA